MVKYHTNPDCVDIPQTPYYEIEPSYGVIADCHPNCASCKEGANSDGSIEGCDSCSGSLSLLDKNCVTDCGSNLAKVDNKCVNCFTLGQYKYGNNCISSKQDTIS